LIGGMLRTIGGGLVQRRVDFTIRGVKHHDQDDEKETANQNRQSPSKRLAPPALPNVPAEGGHQARLITKQKRRPGRRLDSAIGW
jgi:hypothetical protein